MPEIKAYSEELSNNFSRAQDGYETPVDTLFALNTYLVQDSKIMEYLKLGDLTLISGTTVSSSIVSSYLRFPSKSNIIQLQNLFAKPETGQLDEQFLAELVAQSKQQLAHGASMPEWKESVQSTPENHKFTNQNRTVITDYLNEWKALDPFFDRDTYYYYAITSPTRSNIKKLQEKIGLQLDDQDGLFGIHTLKMLDKRLLALRKQKIEDGKLKEAEGIKNNTRQQLSRLEKMSGVHDYRFQIESAKLFAKVGETHECFKRLESAMQEAPNNPEPYEIRGEYLIRNGYFRSGIEDYAKAKQLGSNNPEVDKYLFAWKIDYKAVPQNLLDKESIEGRLVQMSIGFGRKILGLRIDAEGDKQYYTIRVDSNASIRIPALKVPLPNALEVLTTILSQYYILKNNSSVARNSDMMRKLGTIMYYNDEAHPTRDMSVWYSNIA